MNRHEQTHSRKNSRGLEELMDGYQRADEQALEELVERVSPMLMRFFLGPSGTKPYAEDLLQEFWLRVHKARHSYRPGKPLLPWLLTIARYTRVDAYRRLRRRQADPFPQYEEPSDERATPSVLQSRLDFGALTSRLQEDQREVILLLKVTGMTLQEVAAATGTTVGAVKQRAHRAYVKLRTMVHDDTAPSIGHTKGRVTSARLALTPNPLT